MEFKINIAMRKITFFILLSVGLLSCSGNHDYSPKPRGFYRIIFPEKSYQQFNSAYPFTFIYPKYAVIEQDKTPQKRIKHLLNMNTLLNMQFPDFNGTLHLSYETITSKQVFDELTDDAYKFASKHSVKATGIDQSVIHNSDRKVYGVYYTIDGNVASSIQFYITDSVKHYMRGALYFNNTPRLDSIQPVLKFVKKDIDTLIKTFRWKDN